MSPIPAAVVGATNPSAMEEPAPASHRARAVMENGKKVMPKQHSNVQGNLLWIKSEQEDVEGNY